MADMGRLRGGTAAAIRREGHSGKERLGLSQEQFAARFGFSVETIRNYEQGHRKPTGPARVLLRVIAREPDAVTRALMG
jgi:DNA-binding transcriptional regulator YiaG